MHQKFLHQTKEESTFLDRNITFPITQPFSSAVAAREWTLTVKSLYLRQLFTPFALCPGTPNFDKTNFGTLLYEI